MLIGAVNAHAPTETPTTFAAARGSSLYRYGLAIIPNVMTSIVGTRSFYFGGTAVLIVVGVALDTINQIEAQLLMRHYDGILKRSGGKAGSLLRM